MQLQITKAQREEAVRVVVTLFQEYAGQPGETEIARTLMFIAADLIETRRQADDADPLRNIPKFISENNPSLFRYSVVTSPTVLPVENAKPLGFIHSDDLAEAVKRFQQAMRQSDLAWLSLWDNANRTKIAEFNFGGKDK